MAVLITRQADGTAAPQATKQLTLQKAYKQLTQDIVDLQIKDTTFDTGLKQTNSNLTTLTSSFNSLKTKVDGNDTKISTAYTHSQSSHFTRSNNIKSTSFSFKNGTTAFKTNNNITVSYSDEITADSNYKSQRESKIAIANQTMTYTFNVQQSEWTLYGVLAWNISGSGVSNSVVCGVAKGTNTISIKIRNNNSTDKFFDFSIICLYFK